MAAKLIKGAEVAAQIREELKKEVDELKAKHNITPGLVTILVGRRPRLRQLRHRQTEDLPRAGLLFHPGQPGPGYHRSGPAGSFGQVQQGPQDSRHPGAAAPAQAHRFQQGALWHRSQ